MLRKFYTENEQEVPWLNKITMINGDCTNNKIELIEIVSFNNEVVLYIEQSHHFDYLYDVENKRYVKLNNNYNRINHHDMTAKCEFAVDCLLRKNELELLEKELDKMAHALFG